MPDNLSDLFRRNRDPERPSVYEATVAGGAGGLNGAVTVTIDGFDGGRQRWPVDGWSPRDGQYPQRGDRCLVTLSDSNRLWLLQWTPGGGGRGPGGRDARPGASAGSATSDGVHTGTPKHIIDAIVIPLAVSHSISVTPESVEAANAIHGPTTSGRPSDHQGPPDQRWAADMSNSAGNAGTDADTTPQMSALADDLAVEFGLTWSGSGLTEKTAGGYRYQMIYRSLIGGNHYNHVHFGVRTA